MEIGDIVYIVADFYWLYGKVIEWDGTLTFGKRPIDGWSLVKAFDSNFCNGDVFLLKRHDILEFYKAGLFDGL